MCLFRPNAASERKKDAEGRHGDMKPALNAGENVAHKPSRSDRL